MFKKKSNILQTQISSTTAGSGSRTNNKSNKFANRNTFSLASTNAKTAATQRGGF